MKTPGPISVGAPLPASSPRAAAAWQVGQLLHATVLQSGAGKLLLAIGNRQVSAETSLALRQGQQITLQVQSVGERPVLRLASQSDASTINLATRQLLPRQASLAPLLAGMGQLAGNAAAPLPPLLGELIRSMLKQLPDVGRASDPAGLKQAIADSGVFLENRLANGRTGQAAIAIDADFKGNLLRLVELLRNWPGTAGTRGDAPPAGAGGKAAAQSQPAVAPPLPGAPPVAQRAAQASINALHTLGNLRTDLLQQAEAALARLQLQQLAALPRDGDRALLEWLFELPVRHGADVDLWSLRFLRDARGRPRNDTAAAATWSAQLAFDLPGLGPVQAHVQLAGEQVSARFWVEQENTLPLVRSGLDELRRLLQGVGLEVGSLDCGPGTMPATTKVRSPLINETA